MDRSQSLEWTRSMRLQLLESLLELSNIHLQAACWTNPAETNPHYTLIEFIETSPLRNKVALENEKATGVINVAEYDVLSPLTDALSAYAPPNHDWYNHAAVLNDANWRAIVDSASASLDKLMALSFNSPAWLGRANEL